MTSEKYGLIGKSLVHSYSKEIHEALGRYQYQLFSLNEDAMPQFVKTRDFGGLNVTIPYKRDVVPLCDEITELAQGIGSVNTLFWRAGRLVGHNTDYEGFLYSASRAGIDFANKCVLILGTGGTSLTVRKAATDLSAAKIYIASRRCKASEQADGYTLVSYEELPQVADKIEVIVNTTPVGTFPSNLEQLIHLKDFPHCQSVIDVIYNPFKTALLMEAEELGLSYSNGLPMLVAQATAAAGYFLGMPDAFVGENERIIKSMERRMSNIVLIGMPGTGKSTVGKILAEQTGKTLQDMDAEIEKEAGMTIPEIFEKEGEAGFRARETALCMRLGKEHSQIIATGGGAILKSVNVSALRQNGTVVQITRSVEKLPTHGRPLSKNIEVLKKMERQRMPLYKKAADLTFHNNYSCSRSKLAERVDEYILKKL